MAQIFRPRANSIAKLSIVLLVLLGGAASAFAAAFFRSSYTTGIEVAREQPVPFSHNHHVAGLGIDCRYCHTSVEKAAFAGIPPTRTCMTCHSQVWTEAPVLEPVRESWRTDKALAWTRVHDLSDFAYFNHKIHVNKGIGCSTCHGHVENMQLTFKTSTLLMEWCINCHKNPEPYLREQKDIFNQQWEAPANQAEIGKRLREEYRIPNRQLLMSCSTCHR